MDDRVNRISKSALEHPPSLLWNIIEPAKLCCQHAPNLTSTFLKHYRPSLQFRMTRSQRDYAKLLGFRVKDGTGRLHFDDKGTRGGLAAVHLWRAIEDVRSQCLQPVSIAKLLPFDIIKTAVDRYGARF